MERRSDKYKSLEATPERSSRVHKNRYLYDEINSKIGYEEISSVNTDTQIDLSSLNLKNPNREDYQKIKEYKDLITDDDKKIEEKEKKEEKPKNFDINAVLEEAKKNRKVEDELEKKRNIKDENYSVLSNLNKKYLHKKDFTKEDDDELKELIDTITSKTLVDDIKDEEEKELLSELLATTIDIKLENELSKEDINKLYDMKKDTDSSENSEETDEDKYENSFYTASMELSKDDLISDEEEIEDEVSKGETSKKGLKIVFIVLVLLIILAIVTYFVLKQMNII